MPGVSYVTADLTDRDATAAAIKGAETVFHCAAVIDLCPFPTDSIIAVNIGGTENVVSGCKCHGVGNLVYVSSVSNACVRPCCRCAFLSGRRKTRQANACGIGASNNKQVDTVFDGAPKVNADESTPYPRHPFSYNGYIGTKVAGEQIVGFCLPHPKHLPVLAHASDGPTSDRVMPAMATGLATECLHCSQVASSLTVCSVNRYWLPTVQSYGRQRSGPPTSQDLVIS